MRLTIIGEVGDGFSPHTSSGRRLARLLGVADAREVVVTTNLINRLTLRDLRRNGTSDLWREAIASLRTRTWPTRVAGWIADRWVIQPHTVLLGRRVATAFKMRASWFAPASPIGVWLMPHPSGLCRYWNDAKNEERARRWIARRVREASDERGVAPSRSPSCEELA